MDLKKPSLINWSISGLLLGLGFVASDLWFVGFLGIAYWLWLLNQPAKLTNKLAGGVLAWVVKAGFATSIFWSVYPIAWLPIDFGNLQLAIIALYWVTSSLWLGLGAGLLVAVHHLLTKHELTKFSWLLLPPVWVLAEVFGSFLFSVFMFGPGGTINFAYSLGYVGYLLAEHNWLLQLAKFGGVYFLTLTMVLIVTTSGIFLAKKNSTLSLLGFLLLFFIVLNTADLPYLNKADLNNDDGKVIYSLDTYFSREFQYQPDSTKIVAYREIFNSIPTDEADFLILPEGANFFNHQSPLNLELANFKSRYDNPDITIVDSATTKVQDKTVLQAYLYESETKKINQIHKRYLVPQGEFMPYFYTGLLRLSGQGGLVDYVAESINYEVGPNYRQNNLASTSPAILFCFESVDPLGVRRIISEHPGAPFIAHPISHAWFNNSDILWRQLDSMLQVQAVWNQKYIVSASHHAVSRAYSPSGEILPLEEVSRGDEWVLRKITLPI